MSQAMTRTKSPEFTLPAALPTTDSEPKRRVNKKIKLAIDALVTGKAKTVKQAAEEFGGVSREFLHRSFHRPEVGQYLQEKAARVAAMRAGRAAVRLHELLDSGSDRTSLEAVRLALGISGIKPTTDPAVTVNMSIPRAGYIISLEERPPMRRSFDANGRLVETPIAEGEVIEAKPTAE